jgi:predicted NAD/FAD-dependent oxidoreductase
MPASWPQKLADKLNVKTNVLVTAVTETSSGVKISSDSGESNAEHVIVTVPAPVAKDLFQNPDSQTAQLFVTPIAPV